MNIFQLHGMEDNIDNLKQLLSMEYTYLRHCDKTLEHVPARKQPKVNREGKNKGKMHPGVPSILSSCFLYLSRSSPTVLHPAQVCWCFLSSGVPFFTMAQSALLINLPAPFPHHNAQPKKAVLNSTNSENLYI